MPPPGPTSRLGRPHVGQYSSFSASVGRPSEVCTASARRCGGFTSSLRLPPPLSQEMMRFNREGPCKAPVWIAHERFGKKRVALPWGS